MVPCPTGNLTELNVSFTVKTVKRPQDFLLKIITKNVSTILTCGREEFPDLL